MTGTVRLLRCGDHTSVQFQYESTAHHIFPELQALTPRLTPSASGLSLKKFDHVNELVIGGA